MAESPVPDSVRHETADWARRQQIARHAAEDPFAEATVPIGAGDKQIRMLVLGKSDQLGSTRSVLMENDTIFGFDPVVPEVARHIIQARLGWVLVAPQADFRDGYACCLIQKRKRIKHGSSCLACVLPTDDDILSEKRTHLIRHHQRRPPEAEEDIAGIE